MSKTNFDVHMKHLKVMVKWNWWWNFTCDCTISPAELWTLFSRVPMANFFRFWCYLRQLFIASAFRKCKKESNTLKLVQGFRPLKPEIARFPIGFRLKTNQEESAELFLIMTIIPLDWQAFHEVQKKIICFREFSTFWESTKRLFKQLKILDIFEFKTFLVSLFMDLQRINTLLIHLTISFCKIVIYTIIIQDLQRNCIWTITEQNTENSQAINTKIWNDLPDEVKKQLTLVFYNSKDKLNWSYSQY